MSEKKHVVISEELHGRIVQLSKDSGKTMGKVIEEGVFGDLTELKTFINGMKLCYAQIAEEYDEDIIGKKAKAILNAVKKILLKIEELGGNE